MPHNALEIHRGYQVAPRWTLYVRLLCIISQSLVSGLGPHTHAQNTYTACFCGDMIYLHNPCPVIARRLRQTYDDDKAVGPALVCAWDRSDRFAREHPAEFF